MSAEYAIMIQLMIVFRIVLVGVGASKGVGSSFPVPKHVFKIKEANPDASAKAEMNAAENIFCKTEEEKKTGSHIHN